MTRSSLIALATFTLALAPTAWAANAITSIVPGANRVVMQDGKATVRFTVGGQGGEANDCGIFVNYGDDDSPDTRTVGAREGMFPREFSHTYARPGQYTVTAKGARVKQTFGCAGQASTSVTVVDAPVGRRRAAANSCPDGWQLQKESFNRETGAFACVPSYPQARMDCAPGLRYFERDNLIGCRERGDNRR